MYKICCFCNGGASARWWAPDQDDVYNTQTPGANGAVCQLLLALTPNALQNATSRVPLCSCRNGAPVVLINASGQGTPCKLQISSMDRGDETVHVVRVSC